ncbi:hypothetical protein BH11BAC4_BH11BAC4_24070 [soil metagenome]
MLKRFLIALLILSSVAARAQKIKSQATFRMLETANSLLETQQFEAAEQYYKKGLEKANAISDIYCQAVAHKGLGNLYTKTDQPKLAIDAYQLALKEYKSQGLTVMANIVQSLLKSVQGVGELYAGVEVGPKGVKLTVIDIKLSKEREYDYTLKADTAINTDAASLSYQSEKETRDAINLLYSLIKYKYEVSPNNVYIVIGSGLKQELDKYNKVDYFAAIIRPKDLDSVVHISYITPAQEAELSFMGIVPQKSRYNTDQLDIGSGNTKGGYFNAGKVFVPVTFPLGTKSFQRLIESKTTTDINDYVRMAELIWKDSLGRLMVNEFSSKREFKARDVVYLSGGIVWAIASIMHPQNVNDNYTEITSRDISEFRKLIYSSYEKVTQPDITLISNAEDARASMKNINRVLKTYDQKALLAGAIWLDELVQQVNTINPSKKFIYPKYAYVGWISGYIIKKVTQQYTGLVD